MSFLSRIDWHNHDGVNLGMINDFMRNQFYDRILSRYVANQRCTDIGFGTGLLTMLALKHGAEHVQAFEKSASLFLKSKYVIAVNSGTAALQAALYALDIKKGDEVLVPSFTFVATANSVVSTGAKPVFVDIKEDLPPLIFLPFLPFFPSFIEG
mgnify:CR=1 FL=1